MNAFYVQVPPTDCPHHLTHRTDTDMEIPTCLLLLLMSMTNIIECAPILTVREIEGSLTVKEKVDSLECKNMPTSGHRNSCLKKTSSTPSRQPRR
jgi:hypothetical protein